MAIIIKNTNYSGEVLEKLLTLAATGNELVEKGLIHIEPGVNDKFSIPRLKGGKMLQKRKEMPTDEDGKGNFDYSEVTLEPKDFMAFTTFNPRSFEKIWRKWQPKGNLVFAELPAEAQNALLNELAKCVKFELGGHFINGVYAETGDDKLFNGIVTRIMSNNERITVTSSQSTMIGRLKDLKDKIPVTMRSNPGLRILMSVADFDRYDDELTAQPNKGANYTDMNVERFKGIRIEPLANWPSDLIVATICGQDYDTNLWGAVNLQDDMDVIQIDKLTNAGERYFFKMLMKADTNVAFGEECVVLDKRGAAAEPSITVEPQELVFPAEGGTQIGVVTATGDYTIGEAPSGFKAEKTEFGVRVTTEANGTEADKTGTLMLTLGGSASKKAVIELFQANGK